MSAPIKEIKEAMNKIAFEELTSKQASTESIIWKMKWDSAEDEDLLKIACSLAGDEHLKVWDHYEDLGGTYKTAFGNPMFNAQQMTGSPALRQGMANRAQSVMQTQASAPAATPASPKASGTSQTGQAASVSMPSPTSAPSMPTG